MLARIPSSNPTPIPHGCGSAAVDARIGVKLRSGYKGRLRLPRASSAGSAFRCHGRFDGPGLDWKAGSTSDEGIAQYRTCLLLSVIMVSRRRIKHSSSLRRFSLEYDTRTPDPAHCLRRPRLTVQYGKVTTPLPSLVGAADAGTETETMDGCRYSDLAVQYVSATQRAVQNIIRTYAGYSPAPQQETRQCNAPTARARVRSQQTWLGHGGCRWGRCRVVLLYCKPTHQSD